jgi:hypothetical protein
MFLTARDVASKNSTLFDVKVDLRLKQWDDVNSVAFMVVHPPIVLAQRTIVPEAVNTSTTGL